MSVSNQLISFIMILSASCAAFSQSPSDKLPHDLAGKPAVERVYPDDGSTWQSNIVPLVWESRVAGHTCLWLNGVMVAQWTGPVSSYVPFPLAYGRHEWFVTVASGNAFHRSPTGSFHVDGTTLEPLPESAQLLRSGWQVQSSLIDGRDGRILSTEGGLQGHGTSLPATVLGALVRNGVYPNPYYGMNNMLIPDAHQQFNLKNGLLQHSHIAGRNPWKNPYWFFNTFKLDEALQGKAVELVVTEINYRAEIWLNGEKVADSETTVGMERVFRFPVGPLLRAEGQNHLAILIHPLDVPGEPAPEPVHPLAEPGRNMGADGMIALNYTKWDSLGWDWQPAIRDRNMGIPGEVFLQPVETVEIMDLYAAAELSEDLDSAELRVSFHLKTPEGVESGKVSLSLRDADGEVFHWQGNLVLDEAGLTKVVLDAAAVASLRLHRPRLWWPAGHGEPHLYELTVQTVVKEQTSSARANIGIRKLDTNLGPVGRIFRINGQDLFVRAGNYVLDMMLTSTPERYRQEVELARHANLNLLRVWGPTGVPPHSFFEAADSLGILIQQDFLHDFWGTDRNREDLVPELELYKKASEEIVKRLRNHPSIVIWCGGNEGPNPRQEWIMEELLPQTDPWGGRFYLKSSDGEGLKGGGPYHNLQPEEYFSHPKLEGFNSEIGPSGVPPFDSLSLFLPFPPTQWAEGRFPLDGNWAYHDATNRGGDDTRKFSHLDDVLRDRYGSPEGTDEAAVREYAAKAQLLNHETYLAVVEALNRQIWTHSTGYSFWKFNSSWPSVTWQLFDWYGRCHAGFYSVRKANQLLWIQRSPDDNKVHLVNAGAEELSGLHASATLFDLAGEVCLAFSETVHLAPRQVLDLGWTVEPAAQVQFLRMEVRDPDGSLLASNTVLVSNGKVSDLPPADLSALTIDASTENVAGAWMMRCNVHNGGKAPLVLLHLKWVDRASGQELLPALWSDNSFILMPGETRSLTAEIPGYLNATGSDIEASAYNAFPMFSTVRFHCESP